MIGSPNIDVQLFIFVHVLVWFPSTHSLHGVQFHCAIQLDPLDEVCVWGVPSIPEYFKLFTIIVPVIRLQSIPAIE
ncbi:MAG TPA: hypothetical protein PLI99_02380 [archaeon]|nr:hypothetical protein [archaeon]